MPTARTPNAASSARATAARPGKRFSIIDDRTGGIDVVFDPQNPHILFAAMWEGYRTPWTLNSGGAKSGLYRSSDDGTTWKRIEGNGMPEGPLGRIGVSVSGGDSNVVYALIEAKKGGLYRSEDGGENWTLINDDHRFRQRAWYFTHVWADTKNANKVYVANTGLYRSIDGGKSFERLSAPHGDHHGLWIDPNNPSRMINGTTAAPRSPWMAEKIGLLRGTSLPRSSTTSLPTTISRIASTVPSRTTLPLAFARAAITATLIRRLGCRWRRRKRLHRSRPARFQHRLRR